MTESREIVELDRVPPHSTDAEAAVIGSLLIAGEDRAVFYEVRALVSGDSFYQPDHQTYFDVIEELYKRGKPIDAVIVREELVRRQLYGEVGGNEYLKQLLAAVPTSAHAAHYAETVRDRHIRRCLIAAGNMMVRRAFAPASTDNAGDIAQSAITALAKVTSGTGRGKTERLEDLLIQVHDQMGQGGTPLVSTGFRDIDAIGGGVGLGEMMLVGARPSMGKSTIVKQMALRVAKGGVPAGIISLEEGKAKIARNILASEARVDNHKIRKAKDLSQSDWHEIGQGIARLSGVDLYVADRLRTLQEVAAEAAIMVSRYGIKLLVIDYLQRIEVPGKSDYERASLASIGVSDLLKDLNVAGIIPVQLNRGVENRSDKHPTMSDLRDSGKIEQDADIITFLHREDYYHLDDRDYTPTEEAELIVAKWRDAKRGGTVRLKSNLRFQTFEDREEQYHDPF